MTDRERRIQSCIDHINTAIDVDPWARKLVAEMGAEILKQLNNSNDQLNNSNDAISRADAIDAIEKAKTAKAPDGEMYVAKINAEMNIQLLPSVQPEIIRCKDCKHWKDSDGVYRRGIGAESKCPMNIWPVYDGVFYCGYAERRTDGSG